MTDDAVVVFELQATPTFGALVETLRKKAGVSFEGLVIVGGGALFAHGLREAHDLDAVATPQAWADLWDTFGPCEENYLGGSSRCLLIDDGIQIFNMVDLPGSVWAERKRYVVGAETVFARSVVAGGLRVQSLEDLLAMKQGMRRDKDREDVVLLRRALAEARGE